MPDPGRIIGGHRSPRNLVEGGERIAHRGRWVVVDRRCRNETRRCTGRMVIHRRRVPGRRCERVDGFALGGDLRPRLGTGDSFLLGFVERRRVVVRTETSFADVQPQVDDDRDGGGDESPSSCSFGHWRIHPGMAKGLHQSWCLARELRNCERSTSKFSNPKDIWNHSVNSRSHAGSFPKPEAFPYVSITIGFGIVIRWDDWTFGLPIPIPRPVLRVIIDMAPWAVSGTHYENHKANF